MKRFQQLYLIFLLFSATTAHAERFAFVALGDTAYNGVADKVVYNDLINAINQTKPSFTIHVGDIWGVGPCTNENMQAIFETFRRYDHPVLYTPGDNEWTDCSRNPMGGFNPVDRLAALRKVFFADTVSLGGKTMPVISQGHISPFKTYVENLRWLHHGILFVTLNITGSSNNYIYDDLEMLTEAYERNDANVAWLRDSFRLAREHDLKGIVLAFHAEMFRNKKAKDEIFGPYGPLIREIQLAAERYHKPILLIHGDSHEFVVDRPFIEPQGEVELPKYANITRLEVYGAPEIRAVRVTVDTETPWLFGFEPLYTQ